MFRTNWPVRPLVALSCCLLFGLPAGGASAIDTDPSWAALVLGPDVQVTNGYAQIAAAACDTDYKQLSFLDNPLSDSVGTACSGENYSALAGATISTSWTLMQGTRSVKMVGQSDGTAYASSPVGLWTQASTSCTHQLSFDILAPQNFRLYMSADPGTLGCFFVHSSGEMFACTTQDATGACVNGAGTYDGSGGPLPAVAGHRVLCGYQHGVATGGAVLSASWAGSFRYTLILTPVNVTTIRFSDSGTIDWVPTEWTSWNVYRGDLATLRLTGETTQPLGSHPASAQFCGIQSPSFADSYEPLPGEVAYWLGAGVNDDQEEEELGAGRIHASPCPDKP